MPYIIFTLFVFSFCLFFKEGGGDFFCSFWRCCIKTTVIDFVEEAHVNKNQACVNSIAIVK